MGGASFQNALLDAVASGFIVLGSDKRIVSWNAWMATASGRTALEACGKPLSEVFSGVSCEPIDRAVRSALELGTSTLLTNALHPSLLPLITRAGRALLHDIMVYPFADGAGRKCLIQVVDVTNAVRRERFLRDRQNARYDALIDTAPDVIVTVDDQGVIRLANPAAETQFGYPAAELVGQEAAMLFETREGWERLFHAISTGQAYPQPAEIVVRRKDGVHRYFEVSASLWQDGTRSFITAILRDVNDRRDAEIALRAVDKRKDEFLATLAHELRNPLAPLRNGLQLLKLAKGDLELIERTRYMMEMQVTQLVRLIDDLMDVSRINKDMLELNKEPTLLGKIIRQAVETSGPLIDSQKHELSIDIPSEEIFLEGDTVRLTQVFANLLNNAAKYTPNNGRISIHVVPEDGWVSVRIKDNGIGIPEDMLSNVFKMFTQVDNSLERSHGGMGIGLSLVKRLVEMHGGSVVARSGGIGAGSEFIVTLPIAPRPVAAESGRAAQGDSYKAAANRRVLVVDDNADSAHTLAIILEMMGHITEVAGDGLEAIATAEKFLPEVVLMDIGMPKLNGYETARRMRQSSWGRKIFIIAMTGWGQDDDRRKSSEAGFNSHLVKPVDEAEIRRILDTISPD
jgi:PAS domain S-box-containing protein